MKKDFTTKAHGLVESVFSFSFLLYLCCTRVFFKSFAVATKCISVIRFLGTQGLSPIDLNGVIRKHGIIATEYRVEHGLSSKNYN